MKYYTPLVLTSLLLSASYIHSAPQGGEVASGSANINNIGSQTTITQQSHNATIDWQSFNVSPHESVIYSQPSSNSTTLNRIHDQNPSQILGSINSNGRVFLSNPNGFVFSKGSQVNSASFVATTADINSFDEETINFNANGRGSIINNGTINSYDDGFVAFFSPNISNAGTLSSNQGEVILTNRNQGTLYLNDSAGIGINIDSLEAVNPIAIDNSGIINTAGGRVLINSDAIDNLLSSAINNSGIINASGINADGGEIKLVATKGSIYQTGNISADAINLGNGGDIRLIADQTLHSMGSISAQGGDQRGDGGFVETSGHQDITLNAKVVTLALNGISGHWLIDPATWVLGDIVGSDFTSAMITQSLIDNGTVTYAATTSIDVSGGLDLGSQAGELILQSPTININSSISASETDLILTDTDGFSDNININADISASSLQIKSSRVNLAADLLTSGTLLFAANTVLSIDGSRSIEITESSKLSLNSVSIRSADNASTDNNDELVLTTTNGEIDLRNMSMTSIGRLNSLIINRTTEANTNNDINLGGDIYADTFSIINTTDSSNPDQLILLASDTNIFSDDTILFTRSKFNGDSSNLNITGRAITLDNIDGISSLTINESSTVSASSTSNLNLTGDILTKGTGILINLNNGIVDINENISLSSTNTASIIINSDITSTNSSSLNFSVSDSDLQIQSIAGLNDLSISNGSSLTQIKGDLTMTGELTGNSTPSITLVGDRSISSNSIDFSSTEIVADSAESSVITLEATTTINLAETTVEQLSVTSSELILNGDITTSLDTASSMNLSGAGKITLGADSTLTGNLTLKNDTGIVPIDSAVNGNIYRDLSIVYKSQDITLGLIGDTNPLQSFTINGEGKLTLDSTSTLEGTLPIPITNSTSGLSFLGELSLLLEQDLIIDTLVNNGNINLSGLSVDGSFNVNLTSGSGDISLGSLGLSTAIASLSTDTSGIINLHGDIVNAGLAFDFSSSSSILLHSNITLGQSEIFLTSANFGNNTIDGNYDLTLYTNSLSWGAIGQDIALQNISIYSTELALSISENVNIEIVKSTGIQAVVNNLETKK